jgi:hypothetical protein
LPLPLPLMPLPVRWAFLKNPSHPWGNSCIERTLFAVGQNTKNRQC